MSDLIVEKIEACVVPILQSMNTELVDLQYRHESNGWVLRLFVDTEGGVNLDHCAKVSREIGQVLDVEDILDEAYNLEVSSPGVERPLKKKSDFERFVGMKAKIKLHLPINGQKTFVGTIQQVEDEKITLVDEKKEKIEFEFIDLNKARLSL